MNRLSILLRGGLATLAIANLAGCATNPPPRSTSLDEVPLPSFGDPWEPFNRSVWGFNDGLLRYVIAPIGTGYRVVVRRGARESIANLFDNLAFPKRMFASLAQGELAGAGRETTRFVVNTTVGVVGLFDVASSLGIEPSDEDFGQAFASGGWRNTRYLVLPFGGPGTARDAVGGILDLVLDLTTYLPGGTLLRGLNSGSDEVLTYKELDETQFDLYRLARLRYRLDRDIEVDDYVHPADHCDHCVAQETLQAVFLSHDDDQFPCRAIDGRVTIPATGRELPYSLWLQPHPAPVVYILPGLGGHRVARSTLGLAEVAYRAGFSPLTISSAMGHEFIASAATVSTPGFAPDDALNIHRALDEIQRDLERRHPEHVDGRMLMGMSLGGFHTLYIAAHEARPELGLLPFDGYLAINPPVRLEHGMSQLDAYFDTPLVLPPGERQPFVEHVLRKALELGEGEIEPTAEVPFSEMESRFLIGLSFRQTLADVIFQTRLLAGGEGLSSPIDPDRRDASEQEIRAMSFGDYFRRLVLPDQASRRTDVTPRRSWRPAGCSNSATPDQSATRWPRIRGSRS